LLQQVNNQLVNNFLYQQNTRLFFFFLSLWIYFWLAKASQQQPISQTTWLKVTPIVTKDKQQRIDTHTSLSRRAHRYGNSE
jgi:hypothetical protein